MEYRVKLTPQAQQDADGLYQWVLKRAFHQGHAWYNGLIEAMKSLSRHPRRCALAPESVELENPIHQLLYGKRPYRILFTIADKELQILHIRRGARKPWNASAEKT